MSRAAPTVSDRSNPLIDHDQGLGSRFVAGADEVGRGSLAGPLVAAGVLLDLDLLSDDDRRALAPLNDSKRLSVRTRAHLYPVVMRVAARVCIISRCAQGIDERGLHVTNLEALHDALAGVVVPGALCLSDGFAVGDVAGSPSRPVVGGDRTSAAIAAASVVAKVTRDRFMARAAAEHPHWGFEQNAGYSTAGHRAAIAEHGISPLHRRSFDSVAYTQLAF